MSEISEKRKAEVLEKVRKLMLKTVENGATEEEASNAIRHAQRLMLQYEIDSEDIDISPLDIAEMKLDNEFKSHEYKYWFWDVLNVIAKANGCRVIKSWVPVTGSYYRIIGTKTDRQLIKTMFESIYPIIRNIESVTYKERLQSVVKELENAGIEKKYHTSFIKSSLPSRKIHFRSYYRGFLYGLKQKLTSDKDEFFKIEQSSKQKYELMVVKKEQLVSTYIDDTLKPKMQRTKKVELDGDAYYKGQADGNDNDMSTKLSS